MTVRWIAAGWASFKRGFSRWVHDDGIERTQRRYPSQSDLEEAAENTPPGGGPVQPWPRTQAD